MGLVRSFKCQYRKIQLAMCVKAFDTHVKTSREQFLPTTVLSTHNCFYWSKQAWDAVQPMSIKRCWIKTGLLSAPMAALLQQDIDRCGLENKDPAAELCDALSGMNVASVDQYVEGFSKANDIRGACERIISYDVDEASLDLDISSDDVFRRVQLAQIVEDASEHRRLVNDQHEDVPPNNQLETESNSVSSLHDKALQDYQSLHRYFILCGDLLAAMRLSELLRFINVHRSQTTQHTL
ncbi:hypothetical protein AeMF1_018581 [Aphanomyces euteiches]|nr:hypothetical protein AeMF1_018581 [Aphanomyces euteiches]